MRECRRTRRCPPRCLPEWARSRRSDFIPSPEVVVSVIANSGWANPVCMSGSAVLMTGSLRSQWRIALPGATTWQPHLWSRRQLALLLETLKSGKPHNSSRGSGSPKLVLRLCRGHILILKWNVVQYAWPERSVRYSLRGPTARWS